MLVLFPEIKPHAEYRFKVDDIHTIHVEECGNPKGVPVLVVHGGPGAGCESYYRRFFDAERYRIILFDQRGAGRSTPLAELQNNTTQDLVSDMEFIRAELGIEKWMLFGGSWGSTLSLYYAQQHPGRVLGMVLRGIFLCRKQDFDWFYSEGGASRIFPEHWQEFVSVIPEPERDNLMQAYYRRLTSDNELEQIQAAKAWSTWEGRCATLHPNQKVVEHFGHPHVAISLARIECHYFLNKAFMADNQLLDQAHTLNGIPGIVVHGRYDMVCPLDNAVSLCDRWEDAELQIIRDAGHSASEAAIIDGLVRACEKMSSRFGPDFL